jgi:hypothetical protein
MSNSWVGGIYAVMRDPYDLHVCPPAKPCDLYSYMRNRCRGIGLLTISTTCCIEATPMNCQAEMCIAILTELRCRRTLGPVRQ